MPSVDNEQGIQMGYARGTFVAHGKGREGDEGSCGTTSSHVRRMFPLYLVVRFHGIILVPHLKPLPQLLRQFSSLVPWSL